MKRVVSLMEQGSQILPAQDFCHSIQEEQEAIYTFIQKLERAFCVVYGEDNLKLQTKHAIHTDSCRRDSNIHVYSLMRSPSVSGALYYKELCMAAKNKQRRQIELKKHQQYLVCKVLPTGTSNQKAPLQQGDSTASNARNKTLHSATTASQGVSCYNCYKFTHYSHDCRALKTESHGDRLKVNTKQFATSHPVTN